jgi:hypothetical protein
MSENLVDRRDVARTGLVTIAAFEVPKGSAGVMCNVETDVEALNHHHLVDEALGKRGRHHRRQA